MASSKVITAYRLVATKWATTALSGEGARKYGGRWNSPGHPLVYLSSSRSLCALELLVHLSTPGSRCKDFSFVEVELPEAGIHKLSSNLPESWRSEPPESSTMSLGDKWLNNGNALALRVPSTVIPQETNILINPLHPDFHKVVNSPPRSFRFDKRL